MRTVTVRNAGAVYGAMRPPLDDPAELYHEASKIGVAGGANELAGALRLASSPELLASSTRAVRRHLHAPLVELGPSEPLTTTLDDAIRRRRSTRTFGATPMPLAALAAVLRAGYGVTGTLHAGEASQPVRSAPSGGALYPLELTVVAQRVDGLPSGIYHFDPLDDTLEQLRTGSVPIAAATPFADAANGAAAVIVVSGVFWRSRFKYGLRGYRFVLLEAGHVVQNLLLAGASLGLATLPLGGFYDRRVDDLIEADGVDESALYLVCVGVTP